MNNQIEERLASLSNEELLIELGRSLLKPAIGMKPRSTHEYIAAAKKWLDANHKKLVEVICLNRQIISLRKSERSMDRLTLAATIFDIVAGYFTEISVASVSLLLVNEGIETLCRDCPINETT